MDMIWQGYQRRGVRKRAEWMHFSWTAELPSQSSRHDVSVSETKRGTEGKGGKYVAVWKQTWDFTCNCAHTDLSTSPITHPEVDFDRPRASLLAIGLWVLLKKLQMWYSILSSFYFHWCLNIWWAVALLQLLILNKSEGWISLRVAFSISFTISPQIGVAINSLNF